MATAKPKTTQRKFRTAGTAPQRLKTLSGDDARTKQSFTDECDINTIMAKYQRIGAVDHVNSNQGEYGFASALSFTESMNIVTKGQQMFDELPSSLRKKFNNSPAEFLDFVQDADNADELVSLGLANAPEITESENAEPPAEATSGAPAES